MYLESSFIQKIHYKSTLGDSYGQDRDLFEETVFCLLTLKTKPSFVKWGTGEGGSGTFIYAGPSNHAEFYSKKAT